MCPCAVVHGYQMKAAVTRSGQSRRWLRVAALKWVIRREGERNELPEKAFERMIGVRDWKVLGVPQSVLKSAYHVFCPAVARSVHSVSCFLSSCSTKCAHTDIELPAFLLPLINCTFIT